MKNAAKTFAARLIVTLALAAAPSLAFAAACTTDAQCTSPAKCLGVVSHTPSPGQSSECAVQCKTTADCSGGQTCQDILAIFGVCKAAPSLGSSGAAGAGSTPDATGGKVTLVNPLGVKSVPELIANILQTAIGIVGALALAVFIYGGFRWLTSVGSDAKIKEGKDAMKWAAIGLVVIFTSYALVNFVLKAFTG